ncbi:MAG: hypothetical protein A2176_01785 [Spirochaetes bacterium RBG_13_51_14]|nr:MAG: hypothetical protein A2176_01785 [Spirochaetes bacterium RBG_13_51_14]
MRTFASGPFESGLNPGRSDSSPGRRLLRYDRGSFICIGTVRMIKKYTLEQFCSRFAYNKQRKLLCDMFIEELALIQSQCEKWRVLVFGSYITRRKNPNDIDVLLSLIPNVECVYSVITRGLRQKHPRCVDVHYYKTQHYIKDADGLLKHFNNNPINELQGVFIKKAVEITGI